MIVLGAMGAMGEVGARLLVPPTEKYHPPPQLREMLREGRRNRNVLFRHHPLLGWAPTPGYEADVKDPAATVRVTINSEGFREEERNREDPRPEWAVLGDSQVFGFNVEARDRFTDRLNERSPDVRFRNYGVSGFGTGQEYLLYLHVVRGWKPDGVILLFGENDRNNNTRKVTSAGYARPRFSLRGEELVLENFIVPDLDPAAARIPWYRSHLWDASRRLLERAGDWLLRGDPTERLIHELARATAADGGVFVVALENRDEQVTALCRALGIPVLALGPILDRASQARLVVFSEEEGDHWTPWGHEVVAGALSDFLPRPGPP